MNVRSISKATLCVVFGYVAYRGLRSFLRNEITLSITEVVHLPPSERMIALDASTPLEGRIQCETYLMRSYRFLLKLSAPVQCVPMAPSRPRPRVAQSTESGAYRNLPAALSPRPPSPPAIRLRGAHGMVDRWELAQTGAIAFTPACMDDDLLLRYAGHAAEGHPLRAAVRHCHVRPDAVPGQRRLAFELVVRDVVHAAEVRIALPNRYCEVVSAHTGGVGRLAQPNPRRPRHLRWRIGTVDAHTWRGVGGSAADAHPEARLARRGFTDDDLAAVEKWEAEDAEAEEDGVAVRGRPASGMPDGAPLLIVNFFLVFEEPDGVEYDYVSSDEEATEEAESPDSEEGHSWGRNIPNRTNSHTSNSNSYNNTSNNNNNSGSHYGYSHSGVSSRARRGKRRSQRAAGCGVSTRVPLVELTHSIVGLSSGMTVRKLQTLSDRPNWVAKSFVDRWLLDGWVPSVHRRRLGKYAHYTTWFVQPVAVSVLS